MKPAFRPMLKPLVLALALAGAGPALAFQFETDYGIKGSLDTTVSYGVSFRAADRDASLIGIANGGTARSVNEDDGNLNFEKNKPFANLVKATADLELKWKNFGFFGRGTAFYDFEIITTTTRRHGHRPHRQGLPGPRRLRQRRLRAGRQEPAPARRPPGDQLGREHFIPNGINVVNPVDLSKLRVPGPS